jgi:multiple sugar transport system substrate-binding protein
MTQPSKVRFVQVAVLLLALVALTATFVSAQDEPVTITFWKHSHPPADEFTEQLVAEYEAANPNVNIELQIIPSDTYINNVLAAAAGGQLPDIFDINDANHAIFVDRGLLAPVDAQAFGFEDTAALEEAYVPDSLNPFKGADGEIYGMPFEYNSWVMVINDEMFREIGLDPETDYPRTWEEVGEIGAQIAQVENGVFQRQGFAWNMVTPGWTMLLYSPLVYQLGGSILSEDDAGNECVLNNEAGVAALQMMKDMYYTYGAGAPGINLSTGQAAMVDYTEERVGMWILGPWAVPQLTAEEDVVDDIRIIPLPRMGDAEREVVMLSSWVWNVKADSEVSEEAWRFINFAQEHGADWLATSGYILPRLGWAESEAASEFPGLDVFVSEMQYGRPRLIHPNAGEIGTIIHQAVQEAVLNDADPQATLDNACSEIDFILSS